ncbi:hypothetical protein C8Q77DRAFT_1158785 [Trametes polyzona]|nr:hypothetical protein C8Q77DRAFT_1158785 [Trametes polyzona]
MASTSGPPSAVISPTSTPSSSVADGTSTTTSDSQFFPSGTTGGAAASATSTQDSGMGPPSSSLYLFTFLATLFLLLAISSAIIMRGIYLRRRFRRRLEEALAAGVLLSPSDEGPGGFGRSGGGQRRKLKRPTLFDVSVLPPYFSTANPQDGKWERLMPVSASISSEKPGLDPLPATESAQAVGPPPRSHHLPNARMLLERAGYIIPRARLRRATPPPPRNEPTSNASAGDVPMSPAISSEQKDPVLRAAEVQVAVIIAMPNPHRTAYVPPAQGGVRLSDASGKGKARESNVWDDVEDEGVPDVLLGSARVPMAGQDAGARDGS